MKPEYYIIKTGLPENYTSINVVEITGDTVYNKPSNLLYARVVCIGGGGGGGGGGRNTGQIRGAGAGSGGCLASRILLESDINPTGETITVGLGGVGGAGRSGSNGSGVSGTTGGYTSFGLLVIADSGKGGDEGRINPATASGAGGLIQNSTPNVPSMSIYGAIGNPGGSVGNVVTPLSVSGSDAAGSCGGAGGGNTADLPNSNGGRSNTCIDYSGVTTFTIGGTGTTGGTGSNGVDNYVLQVIEQYPIVTPLNTKGLGVGGGGGGNATDGINNGGAGGDAGLYGAGGGGGGSAQAPMSGGNGGDGAQGLCIIVEYLK
jgi:hypothetical protein